MAVSQAAKVGYAVLFSHAVFWAIEMNLSEWREEIREEHPEKT